MKKLLIFVDWYLPGFKAGGQIRSCANLAMALKDEMEVYIVTTDRDLGDEEAYTTVKIDQWNILENNLQVLYLSPGKKGFKAMQSIIRTINPDCIYLNSMFSFNFTLLPIEACVFDQANAKLILAPRGMLHTGALQFKRLKKKIFFHAFKVRGLHKKVIFHATDLTENTDIKKVFGKKVHIEYIMDFPSYDQDEWKIIKKDPGFLRCIFVSRISPKKNLLFLLSVLRKVKANVVLSIVGPVEDEDYWKRCHEQMSIMPQNIQVHYKGAIPNHELSCIYKQNHLFILPTLGENFGHVIFESLLSGRPVLISDRTPWKNLSVNGIGWDLPLSDKRSFVNRIEEAAGWDQLHFETYSRASWQFAGNYFKDAALKSEYLKLFN